MLVGFRAGLLILTFCVACGDSGSASGGAGGGSGGAGGEAPEPVTTVLHPDAPPLPGQSECVVTIVDHLANEGHTHVPVCTAVGYQTVPPSSGNHWPIWAAFRVHDQPVPHEMLVHDLEHGAIVMAHRCEDAACPDLAAAFDQVGDDFGVDPLCLMTTGGAPRSRLVITPDPTLEVPIALSAWQATYRATCLDPESLLAFIEAHYAKASENLCLDGKDPLDPATGVPACN